MMCLLRLEKLMQNKTNKHNKGEAASPLRIIKNKKDWQMLLVLTWLTGATGIRRRSCLT